ncbi:hypothetical protein [Streptomyces sp. NPDC059994]|uniref:hypothetical protein n=1 Tax=Streptomyces sp. NPDC059994 TaxID=3347029 RepID=UPI0036CBC532
MTDPHPTSPTAVPELSVDEVHALTTRPDLDLAHRTLWLLLYELGPTEVRLADLLALDVPAVNLSARAIITESRKTGGPVAGQFSERAAGMLDALIGDRAAGPVFTARAGQRLTREIAADYFRSVTGGQSLHALRLNGQRHATS